MNKTILLLGSAGWLLLAAGCVFHETRETVRYDIVDATREKRSAPPRFAAREFANLSGCGVRMLTRDAEGKFEADPFHKWLMPPEDLIPRALNAAAPAAENGKATLPVSGAVRAFETDIPSFCFRFAGNYVVSGRECSFDYAIPLTALTPAAAAEAAAKGIRRLADEIAAGQPQGK